MKKWNNKIIFEMAYEAVAQKIKEEIEFRAKIKRTKVIGDADNAGPTPDTALRWKGTPEVID